MDKRFKGTKEEYIEFRKKRNEANKRYYSKPEVRKKKNIYSKKYRVENKEKISEYGEKLRARPEYKERIKKWAEENKEHIREYRSSPENKIKKAISDKKYREKRKLTEGKYWMNPETRSRHKKWYEENREHLKDLRKAYYESERGRLSVQNCNHRRLALKKQRKTDLTRKKIREIFERDKVCVYCNSSDKKELDHIISLAKGGSCMSNNFVLACAKCNRSKSDRDVFYWCKLQGIKVPDIVIELLKSQKLD